MRAIALTTLALLALPAAAQAHFIWILTTTTEDGRVQALVTFHDDAAPGKARLLERLSDLKLNHRIGDQITGLTLMAVEQPNDAAALVTTVPARHASYSLETSRVWGVFDRGESKRLLRYYAKRLVIESPADLASLGRADGLDLDVVPALEGDKLTATVVWQGKPVQGVEVVVTPAVGEAQTLITDESGQVACEVAPGPLALRAMLRRDGVGEHDGQAYEGTTDICTLTLDVPAATTAAVAAAPAEGRTPAQELLADARSTRAVWENFPGFSAALSVERDGGTESGRLVVTAEGDVTLEGFAGDTEGLNRELRSLVMHRLASGSGDNSLSATLDDTPHPLGPLVAVEGDGMASSYRVGDRAITEVNREMGETRFTITVLDVYRNAEGQYLPGVFAVHMWKNTGELLSAATTHHRWERIGDYDLPAEMLTVRADGEGKKTTRLTFSEHQLAARESAGEAAANQ